MADPAGLTGGARATLLLVRHGESTWVAEGRFQGRGDPPLSTLGQRQAALVAARLADGPASVGLALTAGPPAGVWYSPLRRAADTAKAIAAARRPPPPLHASEGLSEIDQGEWQGLTHHEVRARWASTLEAWRADPTAAQAPGGERLLDAHQRVSGALGGIVREIDSAASSGTDVPWGVVVAHDGVLRLALMTLLGVPIERFWSFPFVLCGISSVEIAGGRATLTAHNLADHLAPLTAIEERPIDRGGAL